MTFLIPYRDLKIADESEKSAYLAILSEAMESGQLMMGEGVKAFEASFASYVGRAGAVGLSSGTSALYLGLKSLGVQTGDEIVTTSMSWLATANAIIACGATPVFVDVDDDLNLRPANVAAAITKKTRAIVAVHYLGRICNINELAKISIDTGVPLIEDASQAAGARLAGRLSGSWGIASAFSLNPMKPLGALGEAGVLLADKPEILEIVRSYRYLGTRDVEVCIFPEINHKMDEIQGYFLTESLKRLEDSLSLRRKIAVDLASRFPSAIRVVGIDDPIRTTFFEFTILSDRRDHLQDFLFKRGIDCRVKHPILMCDQPGYKDIRVDSQTNARKMISQILSLPLYASLSLNQMDLIVTSLEEFIGGSWQ